MSWQGYVDTSLVGSGQIDKGALASLAGDSVWASSAGFDVKPEELGVISKILNGDGPTTDKAYGEGVYVAGERYVLATVDDGIIYARQGKDGILVAKTTQALVLGHHNSEHHAGNAREIVEKLAKYLIELKY